MCRVDSLSLQHFYITYMCYISSTVVFYNMCCFVFMSVFENGILFIYFDGYREDKLMRSHNSGVTVWLCLTEFCPCLLYMCFTLNLSYMYWSSMSHLIGLYLSLWMVFLPIGHSAMWGNRSFWELELWDSAFQRYRYVLIYSCFYLS